MKIKVEFGFREDIRKIVVFLLLLQASYYKYNRDLRYRASKFPFENFTVKYILIATGIAAIIVFILIGLKVESGVISNVLALGVFVPYLIFLVGFLIFYLVQLIYVSIKAFSNTIIVYRLYQKAKTTDTLRGKK